MSQTVSHCIKINLSFRVNKLKIRLQETQKTNKKNIISQIGSELANRLHKRKRLTIKIGYPLCTRAPVGTKCRGKKSFPFVHLPISEIGGRETFSNQGGLSTRLSFSLLTVHAWPRENTITCKVDFFESTFRWSGIWNRKRNNLHKRVDRVVRL